MMFGMKTQRHRGTKAQRVLLPLLLLALWFGGMPAIAQEKPAARFETRDLVVDSGKAGLAAWQVELKYDPAIVAIVGIEGGTTPFGPDKPPFYDPKGMTAGRIILANLTTSAKLKSGPQTVARIHLRLQGEGDPKLSANVMTAGTAGGAKIPATATLDKTAGDASAQPRDAATREMQQLYQEAQQLYDHQHYAEARDKVEQVLVKDPYNEPAIRLMVKIIKAQQANGEVKREKIFQEMSVAGPPWRWTLPPAADDGQATAMPGKPVTKPDK